MTYICKNCKGTDLKNKDNCGNCGTKLTAKR